MKPSPISIRRLVGVTLLSWFAILGFDFLLHSGLLARLYVDPSPFLLSPQDAFRLIPLGHSFGVADCTAGDSRLGGGLWVWAKSWCSCVGLFGSGFALDILSQSIADAELIRRADDRARIGGLVASAELATSRLWRLFVYVLGFVIVAIIMTVVLQSVGLAPSERVAGVQLSKG